MDSKLTALYNDRVLVNEDDKRRILTLGDMNLVPPEVGIFDEPTRCYIVNKEWASVIMGMVSWLAHPAVWKDANDFGYSAIEAINAFKVGEDCTGMRLRQNPTDVCLLEQSFDGGVTWSTAFDYSLCITVDGVANGEKLAEISTALNLLKDAWDGTESSIFPELVYQADGFNDDRNLALCLAIHDLVEFMINIEKWHRDQVASLADFLGFVISAWGASFVLSGLPGLGVGVALAGVMLSVAGQAFHDLSDLVLDDLDARELVACCMYNAHKDQAKSPALTASLLDNCNFNFGSAEAQLAGAIAPILAQNNPLTTFDPFFAISDYWGYYYGLIRDGVYFECSCPDLTWEHTFDFKIDSGAIWGWGQTIGDGWVNGGGWRSWGNGTTQELNYLELVPASDITINYIEFRIENRIGSQANYGSAGWQPSVGVNTYINGVQTNRFFEELSGDPTTATYYAYDGLDITIDRILIPSNPLLSDPDKYDYSHVTLRGTGVNPFV